MFSFSLRFMNANDKSIGVLPSPASSPFASRPSQLTTDVSGPQAETARNHYQKE
jgi:hypothetical protein